MAVKLTNVGSLQKGRYVVLDGEACTVTDMNVSRPGKHGHAKVNLTAQGIIDGKKRNKIMPGHDKIEVPVIDKKNAQVLSVQEGSANVMDSESFETFDLEIPSELKDQVFEGATVVYWDILDKKLMKQVKNE
ncbi:MAG: translation initiation factor IF-5A [Nanobdellota archaeon]